MNFLKQKLHKHSGSGSSSTQSPLTTQQDTPSRIQPPTPTDVTRYRYHHGTNLGSIFTLEKWLAPDMFPPDTQGESELAAARSALARSNNDPSAAAAQFTSHWRTWVSDADLDWLRDTARCTSVRLPVGYWTLGDAALCGGTPFESVVGVYAGAWDAVAELVARCAARGIGVLVDVHGLPGGANAQAHSGTDEGKAGFWRARRMQELGLKVVCEVVRRVRGWDGVVGVQVVNEADYDSPGMYEWYDAVVAEVSRIDASMPIYISDAWDLGRAVKWCQKKNVAGAAQSSPVVIDTHLYWCFSDADQKKTPQQITDEVRGKLGELDGNDGSILDRGAVQAVVGEYSCVLSEPSWAKSGGTSKEELVRKFGNVQSERYQSRAGGSFFWTYRMNWMPGGEWGFKQMNEQNAIVPPASLKLDARQIQDRISHAQSQQQERRTNAVGGHSNYWDTQHPGQYEHQRFEQGWDIGFGDALAFFEARSKIKQPGADKIGMLDLWCLKRIQESGQAGKFVWEFEHGLRQGVKDFYESVGV